MKMHQHLTFLFSLASIATAQLSSLPACASAGAQAALAASGCSTTDIACICQSSSFTTGLEQYAKQHCDINDYNSAVAMGKTLCASSGITITTSSSAMGSGSASGTMTPSTSASASVMPTMTMATATKKCECEDDEPTPMPITPTPVATWTGVAAGREVEAKMIGLVVGILGLVALL